MLDLHGVLGLAFCGSVRVWGLGFNDGFNDGGLGFGLGFSDGGGLRSLLVCSGDMAVCLLRLDAGPVAPEATRCI